MMNRPTTSTRQQQQQQQPARVGFRISTRQLRIILYVLSFMTLLMSFAMIFFVEEEFKFDKLFKQTLTESIIQEEHAAKPHPIEPVVNDNNNNNDNKEQSIDMTERKTEQEVKDTTDTSSSTTDEQKQEEKKEQTEEIKEQNDEKSGSLQEDLTSSTTTTTDTDNIISTEKDDEPVEEKIKEEDTIINDKPVDVKPDDATTKVDEEETPSTKEEDSSVIDSVPKDDESQSITTDTVEEDKKETVAIDTQQNLDITMPNLFVIKADSRSGAEWILRVLDQHPEICATGGQNNDEGQIGFTPILLSPGGMPWIDDSNLEKGCTVAFVQEQVKKLIESSTVSDDGKWSVPDQCKAEYNKDNDPIAIHLPRLCTFVEKVLNDTSFDKENNDTINSIVTKWFLQGFYNDDDTYVPCKCPSTTKVRGFKLVNDWSEQIGLLDNERIKVIRMKRQNLFARYMSLTMAVETNEWAVSSIDDKRRQLDKLQDKKINIDIGAVFGSFDYQRQQDTEGDEWTTKHIGNPERDILSLEYDNCRDNPIECFEKIFNFLNISDGETYINEHTDQFTTSYTGSEFAKPEYLLKPIANAELVKEAFGARGVGKFVGIQVYKEIEHIRLFRKDDADRIVIRSPLESKGINTSILVANMQQQNLFTPVIEKLKTLSNDVLVVISINDVEHIVTTNHHIRSDTMRFAAISNFRVLIDEAIQNNNNKVIVSATSGCCVAALTHAVAGDYFQTDGNTLSRKNKACRSGRDECIFAGEDKASSWKTALLSLAQSKVKDGQNVERPYVEASLMAGRASDVLDLLEALSVGYDEDERAVLTDYMLQKPDQVMLDYEEKFFAHTFTTVKKPDQDCTRNDNTGLFPTSTGKRTGDNIPLFVFSSRDFGCKIIQLEDNADKKFPKWDVNGIPIKPILDHIEPVVKKNITATGIDMHFGPEIFYIVNEDGMWSSRVKRDRYRTKPTDRLLLLAHKILKEGKDLYRWKNLLNVVNSVGLPYYGWYGDWKECNYKNVGEDSVPILTTCARTDCSYAFPSPAYMTFIDAHEDTSIMYSYFQNFDKDYPWESKIRKVIWRGALSENDPTKVFTSQRWRLCKMVADLSGKQADMFDVGFVYIPDFLTNQIDIDVTQVGGLKKGLSPMWEFQKYAAVLDMDGNSWSSRFGTLLCYNSVAIKVEPAFVDHFYYDLVPWKHYIPIKDDLSDLVENIEFVTNPENDDIVQEIIAAANSWCTERFLREQLARDQLDIWEAYIELLNKADENWTEKWEETKAHVMDPNNGFDLFRLDPEYYALPDRDDEE